MMAPRSADPRRPAASPAHLEADGNGPEGSREPATGRLDVVEPAAVHQEHASALDAADQIDDTAAYRHGLPVAVESGAPEHPAFGEDDGDGARAAAVAQHLFPAQVTTAADGDHAPAGEPEGPARGGPLHGLRRNGHDGVLRDPPEEPFRHQGQEDGLEEAGMVEDGDDAHIGPPVGRHAADPPRAGGQAPGQRSPSGGRRAAEWPASVARRLVGIGWATDSTACRVPHTLSTHEP
jgi:hypothetical protein